MFRKHSWRELTVLTKCIVLATCLLSGCVAKSQTVETVEGWIVVSFESAVPIVVTSRDASLERGYKVLPGVMVRCYADQARKIEIKDAVATSDAHGHFKFLFQPAQVAELKNRTCYVEIVIDGNTIFTYNMTTGVYSPYSTHTVVLPATMIPSK